MLVKMERKGKDVTCAKVWCPILGICALHLTHPSAHAQQWVVNTNIHTPWTHTRSCGQPMPRRPGSCWEFGALLKGLTSVVVLKVERALDIHSPHLQSLPDLRLEPSGYKSDSLTIRPRLSPQHPLKPKAQKLFRIHLYIHLIMILWNLLQFPSLKIYILLKILNKNVPKTRYCHV